MKLVVKGRKVKFIPQCASFSIAILLSFTLLPGAQALPNVQDSSQVKIAQEAGVPVEQVEQTQNKLAQGYKILFTEILEEDSNGHWKPKNTAQAKAQLQMSDTELNQLLSVLNGDPVRPSPVVPINQRPEKSGPVLYSSLTPGQKYAECIVTNALGVPVTFSMIEDLGDAAKNKDWNKMAEIAIRGWAEQAATAGLEYGAKAAINAATNSTPPVLAAKFAVYAGMCAISIQ